MSRRVRRTVNDMDDLLPNELIETTSASTTADLVTIVSELENQMEDMIDKYEKQINELSSRLESIENDFKQVVEALKSGGA
jgi:archaellum component FlaC